MNDSCVTDHTRLLPEEDVLQLLRDSARPIDAIEELPLHAAHGRVLAQTLLSPLDVPPADIEAMARCLPV